MRRTLLILENGHELSLDEPYRGVIDRLLGGGYAEFAGHVPPLPDGTERTTGRRTRPVTVNVRAVAAIINLEGDQT